MAAWATAEDVLSAWIGDDAPTNLDLVEAWIGRAERLIRREVPGIQDRLDAGTETDLADTVNDVVVAMVTRVFRNPAGHRSVTGQETTGQFSGSNTITFGGDNPGALELLASERDALRDPSAPHGDMVHTVGLTSDRRMDRHTPWCSFRWGWHCTCGAWLAGYPIFEER